MAADRTDRRGPIAWMASHRVAPNLLMLVLVVGGLTMMTRVTQEVFPEFEVDTVTSRAWCCPSRRPCAG